MTVKLFQLSFCNFFFEATYSIGETTQAILTHMNIELTSPGTIAKHAHAQQQKV